MQKVFQKYREVYFLCLVLAVFAAGFFVVPWALSGHYKYSDHTASLESLMATSSSVSVQVFNPSYVSTPSSVKGVYMTSWTASTKSLRDSLVKLIDDTELNSVVIDIKDYSGKIVFPVQNKELKAFGSEDVRIVDLKEFIEELHKKGIYVIGRVAVFQDAYFVKHRPDLAVKNKAGTAVWKDRKGISWIDAGSREYWDYIILLAKESRAVGFDEINFDYIRFPSDGNMSDISFPFSSSTPKSKVLKSFFEYLHNNLEDSGLKISADVFGMVTTSKDDMGIGQVLENALPYFDYISPMVYPSHYSDVFENLKNPESHPYETVSISMKRAVLRADNFENLSSTTIPIIDGSHYRAKLRPWLQDFSLRVSYGSKEVREQIKATYDSGLDSWLLWSASNKYTSGGLEKTP